MKLLTQVINTFGHHVIESVAKFCIMPSSQYDADPNVKHGVVWFVEQAEWFGLWNKRIGGGCIYKIASWCRRFLFYKSHMNISITRHLFF